MIINIKLSIEELNSILELLGKLPNSSNTYGLLMKVREQGVEQIRNSAAAEATPE